MSKKYEQKVLRPAEFPHLLKQINDPPKSLYIKGVLPPDDYKYLCVVGTRKPSEYGKEVTEKLLDGLIGQPIVIVSGLALGIDGLAHELALKHKLKTVAFPGSGLDDSVLYPHAHRNLAKRILENGGCLLSEFEPTSPALPYNFPQRNRLMAGMCHATLVIEARAKSGTLITSKYAAEYNREVLAVPGPIFSKNSEGPHLLLSMGAAPATKSEDILQALGLDTDQTLFNTQKFIDCSAREMKVVDLLQNPKPRESLIAELQEEFSISEISALLSLLEIKGIIKETLRNFHLT